MCGLIFFVFPANFYPKHFLLYEDLSKIWLKTYIGLHVKYPLFLSEFNETWIFRDTFSKNTQLSPFSGWRVDRCERTDGHDKGNSRFSKLCEHAYNKQNKKPLSTKLCNNGASSWNMQNG